MSINSHYQNARDALARGDIGAAFAAVNAAMESGLPTPETLALLGDAFLAAAMPAEAGEAFEAAAEKAGGDAFPYLRSAVLAHERAGSEEKAFLAAIRAQKLFADDPDIIFVLARGLHRRGEAGTLAHFRNRLTASDDPEHLELAKQLIGHDNRNPFNLVLFRKLASRTPDDPFIRFKLMSIAREFCDYDTLDIEDAWMQAELAAGREAILEGETPYSNLLHCASPRLNRLATNNRELSAPPPAGRTAQRRAMPHRWGDRIRIGYLSGDFGSTHATMRLLRNVLEHHDRDRFDITLYDHSPDNLVAADDGGRRHWGRLVPIQTLSDAEAASRMRADEIDILVDLKGHTGGARVQILNHAVAPVQASWLGFPGSTVNVDLDYVIADRFVLAASDLPHYHEMPCLLPDSYQPNDSRHRPLPGPVERAALGLPADRFVFASFNAPRKITRETIGLWARILCEAPSSVLWVLIDSDQAQRNFARRMQLLGVAPERLIFASTADYPSHVSRLQAADLGLDTFPYNGHTTTSDMLWAGLPVLTKKGSNFASRVSESLLNACHLPDLVAADSETFVATALAYATGRLLVGPAKQHLATARFDLPLFKPEKFCRNLERAYAVMAERARGQKSPEAINLTASSPGG